MIIGVICIDQQIDQEKGQQKLWLSADDSTSQMKNTEKEAEHISDEEYWG